MMHKKYIRATPEEKRRMDAMMKLGCIVSRLRLQKGLAVPGGRLECHHIVEGRKRLGHWYTIPLKLYYHEAVVPYPCESRQEARQLYGASLKDGRAFAVDHDTELNLWREVQELLGLNDDPPATKILPRRVA